MTLKLQIFLLFLIKTLRYVWLVLFVFFLLFFFKLYLVRQLSAKSLGSCLVLKWLFSVVSTVTVRFSHESFRQRLTSAALYPWYNFIFLCFDVINIYSHTQKQREIQFKPRIKLNQNCYILRFLSHTTKKCDALLIRRNSYGTGLKRTRTGFRRRRTGCWRNDHKPCRLVSANWFISEVVVADKTVERQIDRCTQQIEIFTKLAVRLESIVCRHPSGSVSSATLIDLCGIPPVALILLDYSFIK